MIANSINNLINNSRLFRDEREREKEKANIIFKLHHFIEVFPHINCKLLAIIHFNKRHLNNGIHVQNNHVLYIYERLEFIAIYAA